MRKKVINAESVAVLDALCKRLTESYGEGVVYYGKDIKFKRVPRISSGVFSLDLALGGGWPRGRFVQMFGPESSCKSYLAYKAAAIFRYYCTWCSRRLTVCNCGAKEPVTTAWIDIESTHDPVWAKRIGVDPDYFAVVQPQHGAQAVDIIDLLIRSGKVGLVVLDSIAALTPVEQLEKSAEDGMSPGAVARMMSLGSKKWTAALNTRIPHPVQTIGEGKSRQPAPWENQCTIMCLNQLREAISRIPMPPSPPGGRAMRHAWSINLALTFGNADFAYEGDGKKEEGVNAIAQTIHFITQKNKTFPMRRSGQFTYRFEDVSVDNDSQILWYAVNNGLVQSSLGGNYQYGEHKFKAKWEDLVVAFHEQKLFAKLKAEVDKHVAAYLEAYYTV
jgi:recombination protein RecA